MKKYYLCFIGILCIFFSCVENIPVKKEMPYSNPKILKIPQKGGSVDAILLRGNSWRPYKKIAYHVGFFGERQTDSIQPNANGDIENDWYKLEHVGMDEKKIRVTLKENKNKERLMLSFTIIIDKDDFKDFFELRVYQPGTETSSNEM